MKATNQVPDYSKTYDYVWHNKSFLQVIYWHYKAKGSANHCPNVHISQNIKTSIRLNSSLLSNTYILKLIYKENMCQNICIKKIKIICANKELGIINNKTVLNIK